MRRKGLGGCLQSLVKRKSGFYAIAYSNAEKQQAKSDAFSAKAVGITE